MVFLKHRYKEIVRRVLKGNPPSFLVIGAQKSGTTSLHNYLSTHPQLRGSNPKEIHYFDNWIDKGFDRQWYEGHFKAFNGNSMLFYESTPNYFYHQSAANNIYDQYPEIKMILMLRDPTERAFSAWNMYRNWFLNGRLGMMTDSPIRKHLSGNGSKFPGFREALEIELHVMRHSNDAEPSMIRRGEYFQQLQIFLKYFKLKQIHVVGFNTLAKNPGKALGGIASFLRIRNLFRIQESYQALNKSGYSVKLDESEKTFLNDYFEGSNQALFKLLGYPPDW